MILRSMAFGLCMITVSGAAFAADKVSMDAEKSKVEFVGKKPGNVPGGTHKGGFKKFEADCQVDFKAAENSSMQLTFDIASIYTDTPQLTDHLKSPDFFDVRRYPKAVFKSTKIIPESEGAGTIVGKLTMLDKEVEIKIPAVAEHKDKTLVLKSTFKIDRTKWGMNYMVNAIEKEVEITVELHLVQK